MAAAGRHKLHLLCYLLLVATLIVDGDVVAARPSPSRTARTDGDVVAVRPSSPSNLETEQQGLAARPEEGPAAGSWSPTLKEQSGRRRLVGSRAPTCTYNECRSCRRRCSARGVPVDASDPTNSAYHYKCFCHM